MQPQILVVTDPPHEKVDHDGVAALLELDVEDAKLKLGFPAPEVLLAADPRPAVDFAEALRNLGLRVAVVDGRELAKVPWPAPVSSFAFGGDSLVAQVGDSVVEYGYDEHVLAVHCRPPSGFSPPASQAEPAATEAPPAGDDGLAIAESIQWAASIDLYVTRGGSVERASIVEGRTDFSGLGNPGEASATEDMTATLTECVRRFTDLELDTRLEGVRPRSRFVMGIENFDYDLRKLYSYGTLLLRQVLDSISPELRDVTHYDLGSRIAYVVSKQRGDGAAR